MTAAGTTFVGWDEDGDRVYRMPDNTYMGAYDTEEAAEAAWHESHKASGYDRHSYEASFGKITDEDPTDA